MWEKVKIYTVFYRTEVNGWEESIMKYLTIINHRFFSILLGSNDMVVSILHTRNDKQQQQRQHREQDETTKMIKRGISFWSIARNVGTKKRMVQFGNSKSPPSLNERK